MTLINTYENNNFDINEYKNNPLLFNRNNIIILHNIALVLNLDYFI